MGTHCYSRRVILKPILTPMLHQTQHSGIEQMLITVPGSLTMMDLLMQPLIRPALGLSANGYKNKGNKMVDLDMERCDYK